jgi:hypothetical protein
MRGWNLKDRSIKEQQELLIQHMLRAVGIMPISTVKADLNTILG